MSLASEYYVVMDIRFGDDRLPLSFWQKVHVNVSTGCWEWQGRIGKDGYADTISIKSLRQSPFRHAYRALVGPIEEGLTLDHTCRVRHCANPAHADPCTRGENARRAKLLVKACPQGHRYTEDNIVWVSSPSGGKARGCRTCYNDRSRDYWHTTRKHAEKAQRRAAGYRGGWDETSTCANGHEKTDENTYTASSGAKSCMACRREAGARWRAKKAGQL